MRDGIKKGTICVESRINQIQISFISVVECSNHAQ